MMGPTFWPGDSFDFQQIEESYWSSFLADRGLPPVNFPERTKKVPQKPEIIGMLVLMPRDQTACCIGTYFQSQAIFDF